MFSAQEVEYSSGGGAGGIVTMIVYLAFMVLFIAGLWKTFTKAGEPGWAAIIPIYNLWVFVRIAGRPWWFFILCLIPLISIVAIVLPFDIAKMFGKGMGYGLGLLFLPFIFYPMLGFGDAQYGGRPEPRGFEVIPKA